MPAGAPGAPSAAQPDTGPAKGRENRRHERKSLERDALVTELLPNGTIGNTWHCTTADLSRSGMGLISRRMAHPGTNIFIQVVGPSGRAGDPLFGTVMHFRYLGDGAHLLGVQFATAPDRRNVQEWLDAQRGA